MVSRRPMERRFGSRKKYDRQVKTICQECSVRCGLMAYLKNGVIVDIHGDEDHPISRGGLCAKGIAFVQGVQSLDRITSPAFRKRLGEPFEELENWDVALDVCAESLRKIRNQHGAESIVIGYDEEADLDFIIGATRFAKCLGTPHVYPFGDYQKTPPGIDPSSYPVPPCNEWGKSKCIFFIEADMALSHPVAFGWALDAQRQGATIIAADARFTRTLSKADVALSIMPRSGNLLGLAMTKMILEESFYRANIKKDRLVNAEKWRASFARMLWEDLENLIGLAPKALREVCNLLLKMEPAIIVTGKDLATLTSYGIWPTLGTAMGWIGSTGGGWYPLDSTTPPLDPCLGVERGDTDQTLPTKGTHTNGETADLKKTFSEADGSVRAVLCSGDFLGNIASPSRNLATGPDLIVHFGSFPNATRDLAHLVLPSTLWAENSGLCFSVDQALQWGERILAPETGCRSGLDFWVGLAKRFGWQKDFPWTKDDGSTDSSAFYQWVLDNSPATHGCKLNRLKSTKRDTNWIRWPFKREKNTGRKMDPIFAPVTLEPPSRTSDQAAFPLYFQKTPLISRSEKAGNWWPWTHHLEQEDAIQIHPETARALGIENGDDILVSSPVGTLSGRAWISRMVPPWMVSSSRNSVGERVLVHKADRTREETRNILRELLQ